VLKPNWMKKNNSRYSIFVDLNMEASVWTGRSFFYGCKMSLS